MKTAFIWPVSPVLLVTGRLVASSKILFSEQPVSTGAHTVQEAVRHVQTQAGQTEHHSYRPRVF